MKNKKKKQKWVLPRHKVVRVVFGFLLKAFVTNKYKVHITPLENSEKRQYFILYNHQTGFDQFFVGYAFKQPIYYIATEDIFSMGAISRILEYLVNPIPIKKQTTDPRAVINCIKVAKEGGTIALAPEGNRTYSGRTCYIKPTVAALARHLGLPIAFFKIDGGYGVQPRWSDAVRKGGMEAYVSRILEPEEYKSMTDEELPKTIEREMWHDEAVIDKEYTHKNLAEYLERAIYVCPKCGISEFESSMDILTCKRCNKKMRYLPNKTIVGIDEELPVQFVADWYDYQEEYIRCFDTRKHTEKPLASDIVDVYDVLLCKNKKIKHKNPK